MTGLSHNLSIIVNVVRITVASTECAEVSDRVLNVTERISDKKRVCSIITGDCY